MDFEKGAIFDHEKGRVLHFWHLDCDCIAKSNLTQFLDKKENETGLWASVIDEYTRRKLSYELDRLPVISGMVKEIKLLTEDEFSTLRISDKMI